MTSHKLPHATVATIVQKGDEYLFVQERKNGKLVLNQPAGHIENGESILAAAIRETLEETRWRIEPTGFLNISVYHAPNGITYIRHNIIASPVEFLEDAERDPDIHDIVWLTASDIQARQADLRSPLVLKAVQDHQHATVYPLDLLYEHR